MIIVFRNTLRVPVRYSKDPKFKKRLPSKRDKSRRYLIVPATPYYANVLKGLPMNERASDLLESVREMHREHKQNLANLAQLRELDFSFFKKPYQPYNHQGEALRLIWDTSYAAIFADCGTGKTPLFVWFIELLRQAGMPFKTIVICPKSLIKQAWQNDIIKMSDNLEGTNLHYKRQSRDNPIHIINYESVNSRLDWLLEQKYDLIVFDESSKAKTRTSQRTKACTTLAHSIPKRFILSGSPAPNGPIDLWSQFFILDKGMTLGNDFSDFRRRTHNSKEDEFGREKWFVHDRGAEMIKTAIAPLVLRYKLEECIDMPEQVFVKRRVHLSKEQVAAYSEIDKEMVTTIDGEDVVAPYSVVQMQKFCQITGGWLIDNDGNLHSFPKNPKLDATLEFIEEVGRQKIIIWTWYQHHNHGVANALRSKGYKVSQTFTNCFGIDGTKRKFDAVIEEWRSDGEILVANHETLGYGHTLNEAKYMVYYDNSFNFDHRYQTLRRNWRSGQLDRTVVCDLVAIGTIDVYMLAALRTKEAMQAYLIDPEV